MNIIEFMEKREKEKHETQVMKLPSKDKEHKKMPILADYFMSVTVPPTGIHWKCF